MENAEGKSDEQEQTKSAVQQKEVETPSSGVADLDTVRSETSGIQTIDWPRSRLNRRV